MKRLGHVLGQKLCEAWGIDPNLVKSMRIDINPTDIPLLTVEMMVDDEASEPVFETYHVLPVGDDAA